MPATRRGTTTQRGLGNRHKQQVARLKQQHIDGTPCYWCGEPMYKSQPLSGDHSVPRSAGGRLADRLLHLDCNSARGDGSRDHLRPAVTGKRPKPRHTDVGTRALQWPW